jgi:hypothetical protein
MDIAKELQYAIVGCSAEEYSAIPLILDMVENELVIESLEIKLEN